MDRILRLCLIFLLLSFSGISAAQKVYCNLEGDVVCIDTTTLTFKLNSYGAFLSSTIGKAKYRLSRNKYRLFDLHNIKPNTSSISKKNSPNQSIIQVYYSDTIPIPFPAIEVRDSGTNEIIIDGFGDKSGMMIIGEPILNMHLDKKVIVLVRSLDFSTEKELTLEAETTYEITNKIDFPFTVLSKPKYIKIKHLEDDQIMVTYAKKKRILELNHCPQECCSVFLQKH